jgi:tRNA pseudouridine38-40 synthase
MCRGIVGTLIQVGLGKFRAEEIEQMLSKKDRRVAGMTAPAHGLVLWKVYYKRAPGTRKSKSVSPELVGRHLA